MVATWTPAASADYYTKQTAYYTGETGVEPRGVWFAPAGDHGLVDGAVVEAALFDRLFSGKDAEGQSLVTNGGGRINRVPAFDVTLSAPRSVSLMWALGGADTRSAIEAAHADAVRQTLQLVEKEAAFARRGRGGSRIERVSLSAAVFRHGESRPAEHADGFTFADPNLHTHCVILNLATRSDKSVGALHSTVLRDWKMATGATYHAALAAGVMKAGLQIDRIGSNGVFEIASVADETITYFSARRQEIVEELKTAGEHAERSAALAAAIARSSRKVKDKDGIDRELAWRDATRRIGFTAVAVIENQRRSFDDAGQHNEAVAERLAAIPAKLTETRSVFERRDVVRAVAEALVGSGLGAERIDVEVSKLLETAEVVELGRDRIGLPRYSTPEMVRIEREVVDMAAGMAKSLSFQIDGERLVADCRKRGLSEEQQIAVTYATGKAGIAVVEGAPGTGKTTLLAPAVTAWKTAGYRVVGAASAWRVANTLRDDLDIEARATASWLARAEHGLPFLDAKTVLIIDEAGLLASRDMHGLLTAARVAGAKVLLTGDRGQLQAIGAGSGLRLVAEAIEAVRVQTIVRQREAWARDAVAAFGRGQADKALAGFAERNLLIEADGEKAAVKAVVDRVDQYLGSSKPNSFLIVAKTNAEVAAISREVRTRLREKHLIRGEDIGIDAVTPSGHANRVDIAAGDQIRFLVRNDRVGVINGTVGRVIAVKPVGPGTDRAFRNHATLTVRIGDRTVQFDSSELTDEQGRARLGLAYASTIYGAQGATVEQTAVLVSPAFDRHDIYVAVSRARGETALVVDSRRIDKEMAAADLSLPEPDQDSRRRWLGERMAIAHIKQTTLDYLPSERDAPEPVRSRTWEADHAL
ncbi:relaxase domain-containing protein [Hoeflea sp. G2-23]|uniref:Relaxase domain-containing protein n=1 Tax=Hoeflea algicola TaxID=2983763 RepID=A0ABT3ZCS5_9HYPH|nr:MobF family relaxase [Hoeflea algicola]MCY0149602.1 relaxase domain-containing protein [Hoeflea algicola]